MTTNTTASHTSSGDVSYLSASYGIKSWLLTLDHKRVGILYLVMTTVFFMVGGLFASLIRLELLTPQGDVFEADTYNKLFTMHGVAMIFFFLIPSVPAVLGNFLLPIQIGARDVAFPKLNLLSWYCFMVGGTLATFAIVMGGVDTGWTFYTPYSSTYSSYYVALALSGVFINGFSSILTGVNFLTTIHKMRAPGMTWFRLPLFIWAQYATSVIMILGTPVVAITLLLVALENLFRIGIFDPALGGDPILFQHMFWFYSHPAVYIMIVPGFGVISEVIACFARKRIFGYTFVAFSSLAIALLGFLVWGHHMFTTGQSMYAGMVFSFISFLVGVPTAVKIFNWTATLYRGSISLETPMYYALGFIGLFMLGGLTGLFLSTIAVDIHLHDTYFVVAHFHFVMVGGMVMAYLAGIHFWWPKMTGRMYHEGWSKASALLIFFGFNLTFFPQFVLGYLGMPRRYHVYPEEFQILNVMSTAGASILAVGYLILFAYLFLSLFVGRKAGPNPWRAVGLEWEIPSPPGPHNFDVTPIVTKEAYAYEEADVTRFGGNANDAEGEQIHQEEGAEA
ncbi:MAG TPA: cytochrome c oxidase subunit I [Candidatus Latescibacteria bacterium]|nr:cytochrome c oxidase subunit I [Candidatus Latescibacterota bacterium]